VADAGGGGGRSGPVVIAYDGTPASDHAVREAGSLLRGRPALVLVVWQAGLGFELIELPTATVGMPPAALDVSAALEIDKRLAEAAQRMAQHGAGLARDAGFEAEGLAIADDPGVRVADTIVRVASERDAQAVVVGAHGKGRLGEVLLGSTSRSVVRLAKWPVVVVREGPSPRD
jgi:nucleotide-binding universal stress UspA family protein